MRDSSESQSSSYRNFLQVLTEDIGLRRVVCSTVHAIREYRPRPLDVGLTFIRAMKQEADVGNPACFWMEMAEGMFTCYSVPGDHYELMDAPQVNRVAQILRRQLAQIDLDDGGTPAEIGREPPRSEAARHGSPQRQPQDDRCTNRVITG